MMSIYNDSSLPAVPYRVLRASLRWIPVLLMSLAMLATGHAQETGSIQGKVKNLATGRYLSNAEVELVETGRRTRTNEYGDYRFNNVPLGEVQVRASFTGLGERVVTVAVGAGSNTASEISLYQARADLADEEVFELEAFTVDSSTFDSDAIAQQERRTSSNLKLVQHADSLGDIAEGNIGEFLKNLPGISIDYVASDARQIKLRGMGAEFTTVTIDGAPMASANSSGNSRGFELEQVSLSNVEQLEVYKLPRPDNSANSIGGSVNLVSRNAFAQGGRRISYKAFLTHNSTSSLSLGSSPGWRPDVKQTKINPNFELSYSDVFLDDRLGASFTFSQSNKFNVQQRFAPGGNFYLTPDGHIVGDRLQVQDGPKFTHRQSVAANFDFKATENTVITLRTQRNWYDSEFANRNRNWRIQSSDTAPLVFPGGAAIQGQYHSDSSIGGSHRNKAGETDHIDVGVKHMFGDWRIDYGITYSKATNRYDDFAKGWVEGMNIYGFTNHGNAATRETLTLGWLDGLSSSVDVAVLDPNGVLRDDLGFDLADGRIQWAQTRPFRSTDRRGNLRLNVARDFSFGENRATVKFGIDRSSWDRLRHNPQIRYNQTGGRTGPVTVDQFRDEVYDNISPGFGFGGFDWPSQSQVYSYLAGNPGDFTETVATNSASNLAQQFGTRMDLEEVVTSYYLMGSIGFAGERGLITGGARYEDTDVKGWVPYGSATDYTIGPDGFLAGDFLQEKDSYGSMHPSLHIRYNISPDFVARLSYADTIGRANFADMFGPARITDPANNPDTDNFVIDVRNPSLKPRRSDNIDLTFEYYFGDTSMVSVSGFINEIDEFIGTSERPITPEDAAFYRLSQTTGFTADDVVRERVNAGSATVKGLEISMNQQLNLPFIPEFFKASSIYANATLLSLEGRFEGSDFGNDEIWEDDLPGFAKQTYSYGYLFKKGPAQINFRWNVRGAEAVNNSAVINDVRMFQYIEQRTFLDISADYKLTENVSLFLAGRNVGDTPDRRIRRVPDSVGASVDRFLLREELYGADWSFGVKGTF